MLLTSVEIVLITSTEKLPESHALRPLPSPRQSARGLRREPDAPQRGAEPLQMVWRRHRPGSLRACKKTTSNETNAHRNELELGLYEDNGSGTKAFWGTYNFFALAMLDLTRTKRKKGSNVSWHKPPTMYIRMKGRLYTPFLKIRGFCFG